MTKIFHPLVALTVSAKDRDLLPEILFLYVIASSVTFFVYVFDKAAAMNNRWRMSENTLHLLGIVGGWPGALVAQKMYRHKSK